MSTPVHVPLSSEQIGLYQDLARNAKSAQDLLNVFCTTVLCGRGITNAVNVQVVGSALVGEIPEPGKPET